VVEKVGLYDWIKLFCLILDQLENFDLWGILRGRMTTAALWIIQSILQSCLCPGSIALECLWEFVQWKNVPIVSPSEFIDKVDMMWSANQFLETRFALKYSRRSLAETDSWRFDRIFSLEMACAAEVDDFIGPIWISRNSLLAKHTRVLRGGILALNESSQKESARSKARMMRSSACQDHVYWAHYEHSLFGTDSASWTLWTYDLEGFTVILIG
jgi:hypothetical protein